MAYVRSRHYHWPAGPHARQYTRTERQTSGYPTRQSEQRWHEYSRGPSHQKDTSAAAEVKPHTGRSKISEEWVTWFITESPIAPSRQLSPTNTPARQQRVMSQQRNVQKPYNEGDIYLAISNIEP